MGSKCGATPLHCGNIVMIYKNTQKLNQYDFSLMLMKKLMNRSCVTQNQITMNSFNLRCIESGAAIQIIDTVLLSDYSESDSNQSRTNILYRESASK